MVNNGDFVVVIALICFELILLCSCTNSNINKSELSIYELKSPTNTASPVKNETSNKKSDNSVINGDHEYDKKGKFDTDKVNANNEKITKIDPVKDSDIYHPSFYLKYTAYNGFHNDMGETTISSDGKMKHIGMEYDTREVVYSLEFTLTESDFNKLVSYIVKDNNFFDLPTDVSALKRVSDQNTESLEIVYNNKKHIVGGYQVDNFNFRKITNEIIEYFLKYRNAIEPKKSKRK